MSIACCFSFLNMMNFRIRASSEGPIYVGRRLNDDLLVGVFRSGDQVVDLTLLELRMCFSTLKIIVSFGQLKSVEIVGTQIIFTCCQPPATNLPPIFHQSSTSHPECPTLFESASKIAQRIGQGDGVSHHQLYQLWELNHSCCTWKEQERTKKNIGKTITGSGSKMNSIISEYLRSQYQKKTEGVQSEAPRKPAWAQGPGAENN